MAKLGKCEPVAYSCDQLASMVQVRPALIYKMIWRGEIRTVRIGKFLRIPKAEIQRICGVTEIRKRRKQKKKRLAHP